MCIDDLMLKKIRFGIVTTAIFLVLTGCQNEDGTVVASDDIQNSETILKTEEPKYVSEISKEDCLLCGDGNGSLLPLYWGEENVAIISLNSFDMSYIEINRYDEFGKMIEEPAQGSSMSRMSTGEGGFIFRAYEDSDRAYARCNLYFNSDEFLNIEKAAIHMCEDCMNRVIVDDCWGEPTGMALINFSTGELRILRESLLAFQFGDFYVSCNVKRDESEENDLEMELLIFYCPKRYGT